MGRGIYWSTSPQENIAAAKARAKAALKEKNDELVGLLQRAAEGHPTEIAPLRRRHLEVLELLPLALRADTVFAELPFLEKPADLLEMAEIADAEPRQSSRALLDDDVGGPGAMGVRLLRERRRREERDQAGERDETESAVDRKTSEAVL